MVPDKIILATANANKAREFSQLLEGISVEPMPAGFELPPETGKTFEENARLKASAVRSRYLELAAASGAESVPWVMADDSGIEVDALGGAPGIYSARYAGEDATDVDNVNRMLRELEGASDRRARFVCVIVCYSPEGSELVVRGDFEGTIDTEPHGDFGFGYDPIFLPENNLLTVSQLSAEEKNRISHRARAAHNLLAQLRGG